MRIWIVGQMALVLSLAFGPGATPSRAQEMGPDPTQAQRSLPTQKLTITTADGKARHFSVELARTPREQQIGLMYRTVIAAHGGMLFIWPRPQVATMWMEHCPVPEDMVFIGPDGRIATIAQDTVPESQAIISSHVPVTATLELQGGLTRKLGIAVGDAVASRGLPTGG